MNKIILTTPEELRTLIAETVRATMQTSNSDQAGKNSMLLNEPLYMNVAKAAEYLGLAKQTIYGYTSMRIIPFIKRGKRLWFLKAKLDAWLLEGDKQSIAQLRQNAVSGNG
jgi:excisionase family DNA binding protein